MSNTSVSPLARAHAFAEKLGIRVPILLAPMAAVCPPGLSVAVAAAGGLGACGALPMTPDEIASWASEFRAASSGQFQINLWIPDLPPQRNSELEDRQRAFLATWGPPVAPEAGNAQPPDFDSQCRAVVDVAPRAVSSIMGLYPANFVEQLKARGILWLATATTVSEAQAAEAAGADAIIAQGAEAGGHRGAFRAEEAENHAVGLLALLPQIVDSVNIPVIAAGGISDARAIAASLLLGASAVQIGTGFLRAPEAGTNPAWSARIATTEAHQTRLTRAFSGRPGRAIATEYVLAASNGPDPAPYPVQRGLTAGMRALATRNRDAERMQMWAGQSARYAMAEPAGEIVRQLWNGAEALLCSAV